MGYPRAKYPWIVALGGVAIAATLVGAGSVGPAAIHVAEAQDNSAMTRLEGRIPSSDPASDYVNERLDAASAAAEAASAAETSTEPPAEASGAPTADASGDPGTKKKKSAEATGTPAPESTDASGETAADGAPPEGGDGTSSSLSGSDIVVSSIGESNQVDRPNKHGKGRR